MGHILATAGLALHLALAGSAAAQLRPLVPEMHRNLDLVNAIGEGVALEDYARVTRAAGELGALARELRAFDVTILGVEASREPQFDAYLQVQERGTQAIVAAARDKDAPGVLLGLRQLFGNACLGCHLDFRDPMHLLPPAALFMSSFLNSWRDMNRGLATRDYSLVARSAREIQSLGRVISWDEVIKATFGIASPDERKQFRHFLHRATAEASRIEEAAAREEIVPILDASQRMWNDGCLACHERFRKPR